MSVEATTTETPEIERQKMEVDIACAGFGPAMQPCHLTGNGLSFTGTPLRQSAFSISTLRPGRLSGV